MEYYFDNAATTPLLPAVKEQFVESLEAYGNPSSLHRLGMNAERLVTEARVQVRKLAGVQNARVVFTGCGTEANNLAIFGYTRRSAKQSQHLVTTAIEHPSVLEAMRRLERDGFAVTYVRPRADGRIYAADVMASVRDTTVLVSVMHVNNETGERLPVEAIGEGLQQWPKVRFHVDGIQAFAKLPFAAKGIRADSYAISGHKLGAPKGIGALLLLTQSSPEPVLYGGGQESGLRSGTENVLGITALAAAASSTLADVHSFEHVTALADQLITGLQRVPGCVVPERTGAYSPYIVQVAFPGLKGEPLVHAFESAGLYVSTGSACSSKGGHATASHVLVAKGRLQAEIDAAIRFSLARWQTPEDVTQALVIVREKVAWLQSLMM